MSADLTEAYRSLLAEKAFIGERVEVLQSTYRDAKPFPHLVIDGMFSTRLLDSLLAEMSDMTPGQWSLVDRDARERTLRMRSVAEMGPAGTELLGIVHSAAFLYLLSEITGVGHLLPDPYLLGGGYASMRRSDYFGVHSDRSIAYETGLVRRLAMIIFLNKAWNPAYAGQLELWNHEATRCEASVDPLYNRTVIFEVANPNYHGVPTPLMCPADRMRRSFIVYYHTAGVDGTAAVRPHSSIFAPRLHGSNRMTLKALVREVTPPALLRAVRKLRESVR